MTITGIELILIAAWLAVGAVGFRRGDAAVGAALIVAILTYYLMKP